MHIGIQYCGGCNPRYDRVKSVGELKDSFPEIRWDYVCMESGNRYDLILAVTGCGKECIPQSRLLELSDRILYIHQKEMVNSVREEVEKVLAAQTENKEAEKIQRVEGNNEF